MRSETKLVELAANIKGTSLPPVQLLSWTLILKVKRDFNADFGLADLGWFTTQKMFGERKQKEADILSQSHKPKSYSLNTATFPSQCLAILVSVIIFHAVYTKKVPRKPE